MLKWGLRLLLLSVVLSAIGWLAIGHVVFEVLRVSAGACMVLGILLLIAGYIRTPAPPEA
jgi:hypothetical protein